MFLPCICGTIATLHCAEKERVRVNKRSVWDVFPSTHHKQTTVLLGWHAAIGAFLLVGPCGFIVDFLNGTEATAAWSCLTGAIAFIIGAAVVAVAGQYAGCKEKVKD